MTVDVYRLTRLEGWESRLAGVIDDARRKPYVLGEHDCFRLACAAVEALTGVDFWPRWEGRYRTPYGALRLLADYGGGFTPSFTKLFGVAPSPLAFAQRGDIAELVDETGQQHLGVVLGAEVACFREQLDFVARRVCRHAWRIG